MTGTSPSQAREQRERRAFADIARAWLGLRRCRCPRAGPRPSARRGKYRFQIQVQGPDGEQLRAAVAEATADLEPPDDVQWIVDVDPVDML